MTAVTTARSSGPTGAAVKSAQRALALLEFLASAPAQPTLAELSRALDVPKSSLHGLLRTMHDMGWVESDDSGTRFRLGVRALLVGTSYVENDYLVALTRDALDALSDELGEAVHLARLDGSDIVYLAKREARHPLRLYSAIGRRLPAHATALGKAILSSRTDEEAAALLPEQLEPLTARTITRRSELLAELATIRGEGFSKDHEENTEGIQCYAVPLHLAGRLVENAISCSIPVSRVTPNSERAVVEALRRAADRIEKLAR